MLYQRTSLNPGAILAQSWGEFLLFLGVARNGTQDRKRASKAVREHQRQYASTNELSELSSNSRPPSD